MNTAYFDKLAGLSVGPITESTQLAEKQQSFSDMDIEKGALSKRLGIPEEENIPMERIESELSELEKKAAGGSLSADDEKFRKQLTLAKTFKTMNKGESAVSSAPSVTEEEATAVAKYLNALAEAISYMNEEGYVIPEGMTVSDFVQTLCESTDPELVLVQEYLAENGLVEFVELTESAESTAPVAAASNPLAAITESNWFRKVAGLPLVEASQEGKLQAKMSGMAPLKLASQFSKEPVRSKKAQPAPVMKAVQPPKPGADKPEQKKPAASSSSLRFAGFEKKTPSKAGEAIRAAASKAGTGVKKLGSKLLDKIKTAATADVLPDIFPNKKALTSKHISKAMKHLSKGNYEKVAKHLAKAAKHQKLVSSTDLGVVLDLDALIYLLEQADFDLPLTLTVHGLFEAILNTPDLQELLESPEYRDTVAKSLGLNESQLFDQSDFKDLELEDVLESAEAVSFANVSVFELVSAWDELLPTLNEAELSEDDLEFGHMMEALSDLVEFLDGESYELDGEMTAPELFELIEQTDDLAELRADEDYQALVESVAKKIGRALKHVGTVAGVAGAALGSAPAALAGLGAYAAGHLLKKGAKAVKKFKQSGMGASSQVHQAAQKTWGSNDDEQAKSDEEAAQRHEARKRAKIAHHQKELQRLTGTRHVPADEVGSHLGYNMLPQ